MKRDIKLLPIDKASTITLLLLDTFLIATISFNSSGDRLLMVVGDVDDLRTEAASTTLLVPESQNGRPADTTPLNAMMTQNSNSCSICITRIARQLLLDAIPTVAIHFISCGSWARLEASKLSTGATVKLKVKTERTLEIMGIAVQFGIIMIFAFGNWARNEKSSYGTTFGLALVQYVEYNTHQEPNFTGRAVGNNCS